MSLANLRRNLNFVGVESERIELHHLYEEKGKQLIDFRVDHFNFEEYQEVFLDYTSKTFHIKRTSVFLLRDRYMSFLLHLNEDFDDDLLLDSLDVLDCL